MSLKSLLYSCWVPQTFLSFVHISSLPRVETGWKRSLECVHLRRVKGKRNTGTKMKDNSTRTYPPPAPPKASKGVGLWEWCFLQTWRSGFKAGFCHSLTLWVSLAAWARIIYDRQSIYWVPAIADTVEDETDTPRPSWLLVLRRGWWLRMGR